MARIIWNDINKTFKKSHIMLYVKMRKNFKIVNVVFYDSHSKSNQFDATNTFFFLHSFKISHFTLLCSAQHTNMEYKWAEHFQLYFESLWILFFLFFLFILFNLHKHISLNSFFHTYIHWNDAKKERKQRSRERKKRKKKNEKYAQLILSDSQFWILFED